MLVLKRKLKSQLISIYGCNPPPPGDNMDFFHYPLSIRVCMVDNLVWDKRPSCPLWGGSDSLGKPRGQRALGHQVPTQNSTNSHHDTPNLVQHPPPGASPCLGKSPIHFTHPPSLPSPAISVPHITKRPRVEGDFVFTAPNQRCDVRLVKRFPRSDVVCLPTKDYETAVNRGAFLERRGQSRTPRSPECFSRS